jgi:hypothetical protein
MGKIMPKKLRTRAVNSLMVFVVVCAAQQAGADDAEALYRRMTPTNQYMMSDKNSEIALARSAAPGSISRDADVLILGGKGFETAIKGKNGFVCIVGRGWTSAPDSEFWNPKVRVPMCVNAAAARSYLLYFTKITELALAGYTPAQVNDAIVAAIANKELPPMEPGAMCFMMSKRGYGGDTAPHWPSHLMLFYSDTDPAIWGANLAGSPVFAIADPAVHLTQFVIQTRKWSDGSEDPSPALHIHSSSNRTSDISRQ